MIVAYFDSSRVFYYFTSVDRSSLARSEHNARNLAFAAQESLALRPGSIRFFQSWKISNDFHSSEVMAFGVWDLQVCVLATARFNNNVFTSCAQRELFGRIPVALFRADFCLFSAGRDLTLYDRFAPRQVSGLLIFYFIACFSMVNILR